MQRATYNNLLHLQTRQPVALVLGQLMRYRNIGMTLAILFWLPGQGLSQCGSVGDPIINITFGAGANPDFGEGTTTYQHVPLGQNAQGEGWYRLVTNINEGLISWHNLRDHTGDSGGYMFVVNADHDPGEFYRVRVSGLCENTRFRFSAWIANANRLEECGGNPIPPNVRFIIEDMNGNLLNQYSTGNIMPTRSPVWQEYFSEFDTGNDTAFYLVLINDNPGGCGNDLAIDDIQFRPCGPEVTLGMDLTLKQADTLFFCEDSGSPIVIGSEILASDSDYSSSPAYQWQTRASLAASWEDIPGANQDELTIVPEHNRWYRITAAATGANLDNELCRIVSRAVRLANATTPNSVVASRVLDPLCTGEAISLAPPAFMGENIGPIAYQWQIDEGNGFVDIQNATAIHHTFTAGFQGQMFRLQRQASNVCGVRFVTHVYEFEVMEIAQAAFTLLQHTNCANDEPIRLSGGSFVNVDLEGVYSGIGVSNGYFDPRQAGPGQHIITYSAPADRRCAEPAQAIMTVLDSVFVQPMLPIVILAGQRVTLRPQTNATQFEWGSQPGLDDYRSPNPIATPTATTTYTLRATNEEECSTNASVTVIVLQGLLVPNSFTPNGDGVNEAWEIDGLEQYPNVFVQVFNRWGALVFSSRGYPVPWNGQFNGQYLPAATYYYTIASDVLSKPLSGSVSILR